MLEEFKGFIGYDEEELKELWENALFVIDTNILINFYKFSSKKSTQSLFDILKKLKDENRLWIPHQVALEYFHNYEDNMFKQTEGYNTLRDKLVKVKEDAEMAFSTVKSTHPYIMTEKFRFYVNDLQESSDKLQEQIEKEIEDLPRAENTKEKILELMDGIVGQPYTQEKIDGIEREGDKRYKNNIPPGWEDKKGKGDESYRAYGSLRYNQKYGDLILWNQMIDKSKDEENPLPIIFLTEEKKADWWEKNGRNIKRPQPNLLHEFKEKTGQMFYIYRTDMFVKFAIKYLGDSVTKEEVENFTKELEYIRKSDEEREEFTVKNNVFAWGLDANTQKLMENANINRLMDFLSEDEKIVFKNKIDSAFREKNSEESKQQNNGVIAWAVKVAHSRLGEKAIELVSNLATEDYNKANNYRRKMYEFPPDSLAGGLMLLNFIGELEKEIKRIEMDKLMPF